MATSAFETPAGTYSDECIEDIELAFCDDTADALIAKFVTAQILFTSANTYFYQNSDELKLSLS